MERMIDEKLNKFSIMSIGNEVLNTLMDDMMWKTFLLKSRKKIK